MDVDSPEAAEWSDLMRQVSAKDHEISCLRYALIKIRDVVGTSTEAHHIAQHALEQQPRNKT